MQSVLIPADWTESPLPDWRCPLCRLDWYREPAQLQWFSDRLTVPMTALNHPQVGGGCAACAPRRAALSQLRKAVLLAGLHQPLLQELLSIPAGWQPREEEVLADAAEAIYLYMPDAFADAAREVIRQQGCMDVLWQVMKQQEPSLPEKGGGLTEATRKEKPKQ